MPVKKTDIKQKKQKYKSPTILKESPKSPKDYNNTLNPLSDSDSDSDSNSESELEEILRPEDFTSIKHYKKFANMKKKIKISDKDLKEEIKKEKYIKTIKTKTKAKQKNEKSEEKETVDINKLIEKLEKKNLKDFVYPGKDVEPFLPEEPKKIKKKDTFKELEKEIKKNNEHKEKQYLTYLKTLTKILETKKDNINNILSIPFAENHQGKWEGNIKDSKTFLINYLVNKYKSICCTPSQVSFTFFTRTDKIELQKGKQIYSLSYNDPEIKSTIFELSKMCPTKRFVIIPIAIHHTVTAPKKMFKIDKDIKDLDYLHANMLIYDRTKNVIEHFEPYGSIGVSHKIYENLKNMFNFLNVKYLSPSIVCPMQGPQMKDRKCIIQVPLFKSVGFCIIWTLWYTELRLLHPEMSSSALIKRYSKDEDELCIFLISYSKFINKFVNKI